MEEMEKIDVVELTNANGETAEFGHVITVMYENNYYSAFEPINAVEGIEEGELVIFKLHPDTDEMEFVDDEELLEKVAEVIFEELENE
jgi:hypothetical protein